MPSKRDEANIHILEGESRPSLFVEVHDQRLRPSKKELWLAEDDDMIS